MKNRIEWLGHASFRITTAKGKVILIDPWITGNPSTPIGAVEEIKEANLVLVTHDHFDHTGDAVAICKATGATLVAQVETAQAQIGAGVPGEQVVFGGMGMNIGGTLTEEGIAITMTEAFHSSNTGTAVGYILELEDGKRIYHAGDTGIFASMSLLASLYPLDIALLPIGDVFTMGVKQAAKALGLLNPKVGIPMHFGSFPILTQNADEFIERAHKEAPDTKIVVLKPGETFEL